MDIVWLKRTVNRKLAKCHGYYLQHAKETCLVGIKVKQTLKAYLKFLYYFFYVFRDNWIQRFAANLQEAT